MLLCACAVQRAGCTRQGGAAVLLHPGQRVQLYCCPTTAHLLPDYCPPTARLLPSPNLNPPHHPALPLSSPISCSLSSLSQLYSLTMDVHSRLRTESHQTVTGEPTRDSGTPHPDGLRWFCRGWSISRPAFTRKCQHGPAAWRDATPLA